MFAYLGAASSGWEASEGIGGGAAGIGGSGSGVIAEASDCAGATHLARVRFGCLRLADADTDPVSVNGSGCAVTCSTGCDRQSANRCRGVSCFWISECFSMVESWWKHRSHSAFCTTNQTLLVSKQFSSIHMTHLFCQHDLGVEEAAPSPLSLGAELVLVHF